MTASAPTAGGTSVIGDREPDYVEEAERLVCGSMLWAGCVDRDAGHRVADSIVRTGLLPAHFDRPSLCILYGYLLKYRVEGIPLDPVSVAAALDRDGADPAAYGRLVVLAHETGSFTPAARWAQIVVEDARRRAAP